MPISLRQTTSCRPQSIPRELGLLPRISMKRQRLVGSGTTEEKKAIRTGARTPTRTIVLRTVRRWWFFTMTIATSLPCLHVGDVAEE
jgi:hypothetical protein